jgi:hypothetical protein
LYLNFPMDVPKKARQRGIGPFTQTGTDSYTDPTPFSPH